MTVQAQLQPGNAPFGVRAELARRFALAREAVETEAPRPSVRRMLGEFDVIAEPMRRPFRRLEIVEAANKQTVMLLPGFATHPVRMRYLARQLETAGHTAKRWGMGFNLGVRPDTMDRLERRLLDLRRRSGRPVVLLGWSLGGIFARELAKRHPAAVGKVITMGSPFSGDPRANNVWRIYQFIAGHSVDAPPIEAELSLKPPVETVALWSPRDGVVSPRSACGQAHERDRAIALRCTHIGFSYSPEAVHAVLRELDRS
ncbi:alpha/beta hydrolase [Altererythrobacter arenosus]|uniref:Alpha/beta hydrolase n=1 Tax=Altererythrobacter arenosus TaxID=3032592 RepID=A0ABY8FN50_9SPHN|nr:alpha/beta hydrolase [Altererythrobacter sp. CAU 1644]WFL76455.1 alpha/beta hydrolase [Altererythrobacter sp. CAU 1644]